MCKGSEEGSPIPLRTEQRNAGREKWWRQYINDFILVKKYLAEGLRRQGLFGLYSEGAAHHVGGSSPSHCICGQETERGAAQPAFYS